MRSLNCLDEGMFYRRLFLFFVCLSFLAFSLALFGLIPIFILLYRSIDKSMYGYLYYYKRAVSINREIKGEARISKKLAAEGPKEEYIAHLI